MQSDAGFLFQGLLWLLCGEQTVRGRRGRRCLRPVQARKDGGLD